MPINNVLVPPAIADILGQVVSGKIGMVKARENLAKWQRALTSDEKETLFQQSRLIGERLHAAAEGIAQEIVVLCQQRPPSE